MSIYSGFATRKLEKEYNQCLEKIIEILIDKLLKYIRKTSIYSNVEKID